MSDDLISRQAAIDSVDSIKIERNQSWYPFYQKVLIRLNNLPSVQRKGKWIDLPIPEFGIQCSCCGMTILRVGEKTNYCPSCGAKMERSENDRNEMD